MRILVLAILIAATCAATVQAKIMENTSKDNPACPVMIKWFGTPAYNRGDFTVAYKNVSDKQLLGVVLGLDIMDAVGDFHRSLAEYVQDAGKLAPGKSTEPGFSITEYEGAGGFGKREPSARMWVQKIAFTDGTKWADDGSRACRLTYDNR